MPSLFEKFVAEALASFPKKLRDAMGNVAIVIEDFPRAKKSGEHEVLHRSILLGLYQGVPQPLWGRAESGILPDKITIFKGPIEQLAHTEAEVKDLVKEVLWHEIGHHFGFTDAQLRGIEARRKKKRHGS
ncbi:MAG: metallopeptidase family protein [Patescibacteria group bacterium]